jgi:ubiquitin C-terminal hydrolase
MVAASDHPESTVCKHLPKSQSFNAKALRTALKGSTLTCIECNRTSAACKDAELWICSRCGQIACDNGHTKKHYETDRSGQKHALFFQLNDFKLRCFECDYGPTTDVGSDKVKKFLDEMKSIVGRKKDPPSSRKGSTVNTPAEKEQSAIDKPLLNGKTKDAKITKSNTSEGIKDIGNLLLAKGLPNLGNTCFFNSVMQCIMHTTSLQMYAEHVGKEECIRIAELRSLHIGATKVEVPPAEIPLPKPQMALVTVFEQFMSEFRCARSPSPKNLFAQICQKTARFRGYAQQDAHELFCYLLDGLRQEELDRYKQGIVDYLGNPKRDTQTAALAKGYLECAGRPIIDCVFGGTLLQTIRCAECGHVSTRREPFLDLSLPLSRQRHNSGQVTTGSRSRKTSESTLSKYQKKKAMKKGKHAKHVTKKKDQKIEEATEEPTDNGIVEEEKEEDNVGEEEEDAENVKETKENGICDTEMEYDENCTEISNGVVDYTAVLSDAVLSDDSALCLENALKQFTAVDHLSAANSYECEKCCEPINKKKNKDTPARKVEAFKRYLVCSPPITLVLHLKRFEKYHAGTRTLTKKLREAVPFPPTLDLAPFCAKHSERIRPGQKEILYALYGVVCHSGDMGGGHYVAYVRSHQPHRQLSTFFRDALSSRHSLVDTLLEAHSNGIVSPPKAAEDDKSEAEDMSYTSKWFYVSDTHVTSVPQSKALSAEAYLLFYERLT